MDDVFVKRVRKRIKMNQLTLVNMRAETNIVCTLKNEARDSEEAREIEKYGNNKKVGT